jgi:hypothetical protein
MDRDGMPEAGLHAWQIFHGNDRIENHDPDGLAVGGILGGQR